MAPMPSSSALKAGESGFAASRIATLMRPPLRHAGRAWGDQSAAV